jgi:hypothetical protein
VIRLARGEYAAVEHHRDHKRERLDEIAALQLEGERPLVVVLDAQIVEAETILPVDPVAPVCAIETLFTSRAWNTWQTVAPRQPVAPRRAFRATRTNRAVVTLLPDLAWWPHRSGVAALALLSDRAAFSRFTRWTTLARITALTLLAWRARCTGCTGLAVYAVASRRAWRADFSPLAGRTLLTFGSWRTVSAVDPIASRRPDGSDLTTLAGGAWLTVDTCRTVRAFVACRSWRPDRPWHGCDLFEIRELRAERCQALLGVLQHHVGDALRQNLEVVRCHAAHFSTDFCAAALTRYRSITLSVGSG